MNPQQASLLDDLIDTDITAIEAKRQALQAAPSPTETKQKPNRKRIALHCIALHCIALPTEFPRALIQHESNNTHCQCDYGLKRIGKNVSEKLDYTPAMFTVERHVRGKWACDDCETLTQAPVPV